ncbi:flavodoxin domain-containing protein [Ferrimonas sp. SCSIO 43195]|uniref:flavodoxin domain-containing protein n=1 Tax=Ferrimonas sp. SCSIO 43195 TaxID=2822844 RepID=UPI002075D351|nr:flavodoxin domain-containing protein [Ferrimonas sp. SCSIO 43195]USD37304.1 flavodoxin domain-containing protein [Ferrimonas sp. SCSIO 43195]
MNQFSFYLKNLLFTPIYEQGDILIGYASQTGTAKGLAEKSAELLQASGRSASCLPLSQVSVEELDNYQQVLIFVSTYGHGEFPDNGIAFFDRLCERTNPLNTKVDIFAIGDRNYGLFCEAGKLLHEQFIRLEAAHDNNLQLVDGAPYQRWQQWFADYSGLNPDGSVLDGPVQLAMTLTERGELHSQHCSIERGAYRLRFTLAQTDKTIQFQSGDLIGVVPPNETLERLYSVSDVFDDGVELCIGKVVYQQGEVEVVGKCSDYLINRLSLNQPIEVSHRAQGGLVLPKPQQPLLMVATGTGIAPMMCLLRERVATGASASNWLVFGNRHSEQDFYYQQDLEQMRSSGQLSRLDLAFSREGDKKVYVQDKLQQNRQHVLRWLLDDNGLLYVCGQPMLKSAIREVLVQALQERLGDATEAKVQYQQLLDKQQIVYELY